MGGKHRRQIGIGDIILYGALIALVVSVLSICVIALGGSR